MKRDTEKMYAAMKPWKLFFIVALPGMVSMFAMSIYSIIEGIFIGQKLGEGAFAAVNIAMPLVMINFSLADLIGVGASVPISIALGKKDHKTANNVFSCSVIMIFISSVLMGIIMFLAAEPLCRMMGADDALLDTSMRYLRTYALCSPLTTIFFAMDNYLRISGYVKNKHGDQYFLQRRDAWLSDAVSAGFQNGCRGLSACNLNFHVPLFHHRDDPVFMPQDPAAVCKAGISRCDVQGDRGMRLSRIPQ